jgi:thiol-disulfide isomerase/thioredoxin
MVTGVEPKNKGLLTVGSEAPEWNLSDPSGKAHSLKDYLGKVVLIDFWGTWCVPCRKTMPGIQILSERFKTREVAVFGISVADEEGNPVEYMKKSGYTYGLLLKGDDVATAYRAQVLPTLYIIGKDGKIIHAEFGHRPQAVEELTKKIENALK